MQVEIFMDAMEELRKSLFPTKQPYVWARATAQQTVTASRLRHAKVLIDVDEQDLYLMRHGFVTLNYALARKPLAERSKEEQAAIEIINMGVHQIDGALMRGKKVAATG